jgi:hypothetical protein
MFLHVTRLSYLDEYRLRLTFNNQLVKIVDLQNELEGEIFEPLIELPFFRQVYLSDETGTIKWPNRADFAPEFLFEIGEEILPMREQLRDKTLVAV